MTGDEIFSQASRSDERSVSDQVRILALAGYGPGDRWTVPMLTERIGSRADADAIVTALLGAGVLDRVHHRCKEGWIEWRLTDEAIEGAEGLRLPEADLGA